MTDDRRRGDAVVCAPIPCPECDEYQDPPIDPCIHCGWELEGSMTDDITAGDVEGVREDLLDQLPDDAPEEYRSAWIDAVIEFDRRLTDRDEE